MIPVRQSTAFETAIGPVLDSSGAAVTDCVVGDLKLKKTTGNFAALNGSATLTHVSAGVYDLVLTTSDTDTVGTCVIAIDDTTNACGSLYLQVVEEAIYDAFYAASATGLLPTNVTQLGGSATPITNMNTVFNTDFATNYSTTNDKWQVEADVLAWRGDLPDTLVAGRVVGDVGGINGSDDDIEAWAAWTETLSAQGELTASSFDADCFVAANFATDVTTEFQSGLATADKMLGYFQLIARKDAAVFTDRTTELGEINANEGSGAGGYSNLFDSQEATRDQLTTVGTNVDTIDNLVDDLESRLGTPSDLGSGASVAANLVDIEGQTGLLRHATYGLDKLARTGADSDTLETLSDQIDGVTGGGATNITTETTIIEAD